MTSRITCFIHLNAYNKQDGADMAMCHSYVLYLTIDHPILGPSMDRFEEMAVLPYQIQASRAILLGTNYAPIE